MDTLNLNNNTFSDSDIESLFNLKTPYTANDILSAKYLLTKLVYDNYSLENEKQTEVLFFIDRFSERIQQKLKNTSGDESVAAGASAAGSGAAGSGMYTQNVAQHGSNFLIENPDRQIGQTAKIENGRLAPDSSNVPPGHMNPINVRTITQAISIDSRFRPNYYAAKSTNFDVTLPEIQKNVVSMRVAAIELPITYYAISKTNGNSTCLIMDLSNNTNAWLLTLPDGNYEQSWAKNSKAAFIETGMTDSIEYAVPVTINAAGKVTANPGGSGTSLTSADLVFTLDRISGRSFFTAVSGGQLSPSGFKLRFNVDNDGNLNMDANIQLRLGWQLGYRAAEYVATPKCVSEGICMICGPRYGFISINDYQKNTGPSYMVAYANSVLQDNIITRINLAELQADVGVYQSSSNPGLSTQLNRTREYFGPVDIQRLHIALYDEYGRIIDLNNMDWSFTLAFEVLYN
jgi:hypothetical protein